MATEWSQEAGMTGGVSVDNVREFSEIAEENADASAVSAAEAEASATASAASAASSSASASQASTSAANSATSASQSATSATASANSASAANTSANNASTSATNAANSASAASTSATSAATSASTASGYANDAAVSEANAATSETNAATSETNAATSASTASTQATNSANSATASATSATNSANSATAAANSASAASTSESNASTSASTATTQAGIATTQAGIAASEASDAATSASTATTQAGIATTQATNAASSATSAQASLDEFQGQYHGALATAPTVGVDAGDLYFDTAIDEMMVYSGTEWKKAGSTVNGTSKRQTYTATASQTAFSVSGGYDSGFADVYLNGVKLVNGVDVDVSSGTGFTLTTGATVGDNVDFIGYGAFLVADTYTQAEVDNLIANVDALPDQTGHADQYLKTNGTTADWSDVGAINGVFYENDQTVSTNYTITSGKNAMSAGEITIADGVTVTVPNGSTWSIV